MLKRYGSHPLHIVMLVDVWYPFVGGGQVHVSNLSRQLVSDFRHSIEIIYPKYSNFYYRILWSLLAPLWLAVKFQGKKIDLIHSHGFAVGLVGKILASLLSVPVIHTVHGSHLLDTKPYSLWGKIERWLLTKIRYSGQITVSQSFLHYKNINQPVVIRNGVDVKSFDDLEVRKANEPTIIWVGRLHPHKGVDILKAAYEQIKKKIPTTKLNMIHSGKLTGNRLVKAYKEAHVFVLPSLAEGQPITILEAWAAKLPVVVTKVGDNPYLVANNRNGLLAQPGGVDDLVTACIDLLQHKTKAEQLALAGYRLVKNELSWGKVAKKTNDYYFKVINGFNEN